MLLLRIDGQLRLIFEFMHMELAHHDGQKWLLILQ